MKITDIKCYLVEEPDPVPDFEWRRGVPGGMGDGTPRTMLPRVAYLRVDTDAGITGALRQMRGDAVASTVLRRYKSLIGENILHTEKLWQRMWEIDRLEELQIHQFGMLDLLAWDIKSKAANMPLYQLLGGYNPKVEAYASTATWPTLEEYEKHIKACMDVGFTAFKLHGWGDVKDDIELCRALRSWTGDDAVLMYDGTAAWGYEDALYFGRHLEEVNFYWYEEPMREFDLYTYKKLCDDLDIPILAAETSDGSHWNAATWIRMGALDMMRTSTFLKGGITGAIKVAHLAEAHGMKAQVHGLGNAQLQIAAAIPNNDYYEQIVYNMEQIQGLATQAEVPIIDGYAEVNGLPGLGLDPDWDWLEKNAVAVI